MPVQFLRFTLSLVTAALVACIVLSAVQPAQAQTAGPTPPSTNPQPISINQVGFFPTSVKVATFAPASQTPIDWALKDGNGQTVLTGKTIVLKKDGATGEIEHQIDFSAFETPGKGYTLEAGGFKSDPFEIGASLYGKLKLDALRYFYLSRSGLALDPKFAGAWARPAGHLSDDKVTCYTGPDSTGKNWPKCDYTLNASGGWFDAGDYGKYVVNGGIAEWTLLNAYERNPSAFADGTLNIPESGNGVPDILDEARWEMEFLLSMQVPAGQPLAGMAHHKLHGLQWDPMPGLPPAQSDTRFLFPPSTAATLNLAATASQCARVWKNIDANFSARCLKAAQAAWVAAKAHPDMLAAEFPSLGGGAYGDAKVSDEFYWAAAELYLTTGNPEYHAFLTTSPDNLSNQPFYWGDTAALGTISLAVVGKDAAARASIVKQAGNELAIMYADSNGYFSPLAPDNYQWGSDSDALNRALMLALAYDFTGTRRYLDAATEAMNYILGRNALNFSFVSGYGSQSLQHPHHRFWANQPSNGYPPPPPGVLSGGPNGNPSDPAATGAGLNGKPPAISYVDEIGSYSTNEVAINWNAPLAWMAAYLDDTAKAPAPQPVVVPTNTPVPSTPAQSNSWPLILGGALLLGLLGFAAVTWRRRRS